MRSHRSAVERHFRRPGGLAAWRRDKLQRYDATRYQWPHLEMSAISRKLLQAVFGKDKSPCRLVYGVASLPLGTPVELDVIFEVAG